MASSISVAVRVRPPTERERNLLSPEQSSPVGVYGDNCLTSTPTSVATHRPLRSIIRVLDQRVLIFDPPESNPLHHAQRQILARLGGGRKVKDMRFCFDRVFDETASQEEVYEGSARELISGVLDGLNATVFAYGATGCGKTHTITGTPDAPGIVYLLMRDLFERIANTADETTAEISISYLEIYNETIKDLLNPSSPVLNLREANSSVSVPGLTTMTPQSASDVISLISSGNSHRTVHGTEANAVSSRSHAVLSVNIRSKPKTAALTDDWAVATLSVIDLAGSERAAVTRNKGDRLLEGANINKSLLALGNCINALCDPKTRNGHVPYRNSKLTRLLKHSLGGNCRTLMIVCVAPTSAHYDETHNTLQYANRAKEIKTKVTRNVISVDRHVSQYVQVIYQLRQELEERKSSDSAREERSRKELNRHRLETDSAVLKARKHWEDYMLKACPAAHAKGRSEGLTQLRSALNAWSKSIASCSDLTSEIREKLDQEVQFMLSHVGDELNSTNLQVEDGLIAKSMYEACISSLGRNVERNLGEEGKTIFDREAQTWTKQVGDQILDSAHREGRADALSRSVANTAIWLTSLVNQLSISKASEEFCSVLSNANKTVFQSLTSPSQESNSKLSLQFSLPPSSFPQTDSKSSKTSIFSSASSSSAADVSSNSSAETSLIGRPSKARRPTSSTTSPSKSAIAYFSKRSSPRKQVVFPNRNPSQSHQHSGILKARLSSGQLRSSLATGEKGTLVGAATTGNGPKSAGVRWRDVESEGDEMLESFDRTASSLDSSITEESMMLNQSSTLLNVPSLSLGNRKTSFGVNESSKSNFFEPSLTLQGSENSREKHLEPLLDKPSSTAKAADSSIRSSRMKAGYLSRNRAQKPPSTSTPLDSLGEEEEEGDLTVTLNNSKEDLSRAGAGDLTGLNPLCRPPLSETVNSSDNMMSVTLKESSKMGKERRRDSLVGPIRKLKAPRRQSLNFYNKQQVSQRSSWAPSANSTENNESSLINSSQSVPYLRASRVPVIDGKNFPATTMTTAAKMVTEGGNMSLSPRKMRSSSGTTKKFGRRSLAIGGGGWAGNASNDSGATSGVRTRRISMLPTPVGNSSLSGHRGLNSSNDRTGNGNGSFNKSQPVWR